MENKKSVTFFYKRINFVDDPKWDGKTKLYRIYYTESGNNIIKTLIPYNFEEDIIEYLKSIIKHKNNCILNAMNDTKWKQTLARSILKTNKHIEIVEIKDD